MKLKIASLALCAAMAAPAAMADTPIQLSVPGVNLPAGNVTGVRLNALYGHTSSVTGVNFSFLGLSDIDTFKGLNFGLAFGINRTRSMMTGIEFGLANWNDGNAKGVDFGLANYTAGNFTGAQFGTFNYAGTLNGLQFGFVNATDHINQGVQIGLINYDKSGTFVSKNLPVFPIINARF
ncbi:TPA: LA_2272 family surface repeat-containing protein [Photobacterium damselae]|uniref:PhaC PHA synthase n=1 Tax=Photobacterium damselae TaxID=38293 RepID=A0ABD6X6D3_PHODM|nr:hypothetical protein [Photobacterium damselae]EJN6960078.1 hypothetical protein [Photobacterium damselae]KAB1509865.1 hypothetical protein FD717_012430 [Photobacterium damselae subsp. damselae]MCG3843837.1 hypothetical protein [Photobacterium damselae]MCG9776890.1 hypothetical protein [Photobacterium damselae]OBU46169.1 hypothetical protein AYY27_00800 [Photobacterium damselae]